MLKTKMLIAGMACSLLVTSLARNVNEIAKDAEDIYRKQKLSPPTMSIRQVQEGAIKIDGREDDAGWKTIRPIPLVNLANNKLSDSPQYAKLAWDNQNLYIFCRSNVPTKVKNTTAGRPEKEKTLFMDNTIMEVFLELDDDGRNYMELHLDPNGAIAESKVSCPYGNWKEVRNHYDIPESEKTQGDWKWNCVGLQAISKIAQSNGARCWNTEFSIPWKAINQLGKSGKTLPDQLKTFKLNLVRMIANDEENFYGWPFKGKNPCHGVQRYATIVLDSPKNADTLYQFDGEIDKNSPGWTFVKKSSKVKTYNQFEGYYANKGGKLVGPSFNVYGLDFKYLKVSFEYKAAQQAYTALCFNDLNGNWQPDSHHGLDPCKDFTPYHGLFYTRENGATSNVIFQSLGGMSIRNLKVEMVSTEDAIQLCDEIYKKLPPIKVLVAADRFKYLPRTMDALKTGKPWRIVMLGDSIINDTFNSNFQALIKRLYPKSDARYICAVRGSTGCWYYREPEHYQEYVGNNKPDLLIIGGISESCGKRGGWSTKERIENIRKVITMARKKENCETLLLTGPLGLAWLEGTAENAQKPQKYRYKAPFEFWDMQKELAREMKIAFQDQGPMWRDYLRDANKPKAFFNRDTHHGNAKGQQVVAKMLEEFFKREK